MLDRIHNAGSEPSEEAKNQKLDHERIGETEPDRQRGLAECGGKRKTEDSPEGKDEEGGADRLHYHVGGRKARSLAVQVRDDPAAGRVHSEKTEDDDQHDHEHGEELAEQHRQTAITLRVKRLDGAPSVPPALQHHRDTKGEPPVEEVVVDGRGSLRGELETE